MRQWPLAMDGESSGDDASVGSFVVVAVAATVDAGWQAPRHPALGLFYPLRLGLPRFRFFSPWAFRRTGRAATRSRIASTSNTCSPGMRDSWCDGTSHPRAGPRFG